MSDALDRVVLEDSWKEALSSEFEAGYMATLREFLVREKRSGVSVYPPSKLIFQALDRCPLVDVKVVIIGQDPYIRPGQAHGLSFSVPDGIALPPSLKNIFQELQDDLRESEPDKPVFEATTGNLLSWAEQGVLLLNATLTVKAGQSGSHQGLGWEIFTDRIVEIVNERCEHVVFLLWGNYAKGKARGISSTRHLLLSAAHPSPFSANSGFFGCRHFSKANRYLVELGIDPIDWRRGL